MLAERAIYSTSSLSLLFAANISPSLLVRLSPSSVNVYTSSPVFIAIDFRVVNWDRLLILL